MLDVNAIDLHYGAAQALRGVSLKAEVGKVTCVLGRNGVGKTSLLRAIVGQHPVSNGSITFNGEDITRLSTVERARHGIAIVPQGREIFPLLTVAGEPGDRLCAAAARPAQRAGRRVLAVSGAARHARPPRRRPVRRPAAAIGDRPRAGDAAAAACCSTSRPKASSPRSSRISAAPSTICAGLKEMAIVLVEQYLDFAQELGDYLVVMDRGSIVYASDKAGMDEAAIKRALAI